MRAVGAERHAEPQAVYLARVSLEFEKLRTNVRVPEPHRRVEARVARRLPLGTELHAKHGAGVSLEFEELLPGARVPQPRPSYPPTGGNQARAPSGLNATLFTTPMCPLSWRSN